MDENNIKDFATLLYKDIRKYLDLKFDYYKLDIVEKLIFLISKGFGIFLAFVIFPIIVIFLSFGGAFYLGEILGADYLGFFAVAGILFLFGLILLALKKTIFIKPLIRIFIDTFFNNEAEKKKNGKN